jgi:hypothetical protein
MGFRMGSEQRGEDGICGLAIDLKFRMMIRTEGWLPEEGRRMARSNGPSD